MQPKNNLTKHRTWAAWKIVPCLTILLLFAWQFPHQPVSANRLFFPNPVETTSPAAQTTFLDFESGFPGKLLAKASWVSVKDGFNLPIIQQPEGNPFYVSNKPDVITQFSSPALDGVVGLLAHDFRAGAEFYGLKIGQMLKIFYEQGTVRDYQVVSIHRFQKLDSSSVYSDLVDLETNEQVTTSQVYDRFYRGSHHVTFQTCLAGNGRLDWGLYFVIAEPILSPVNKTGNR